MDRESRLCDALRMILPRAKMHTSNSKPLLLNQICCLNSLYSRQCSTLFLRSFRAESQPWDVLEQWQKPRKESAVRNIRTSPKRASKMRKSCGAIALLTNMNILLPKVAAQTGPDSQPRRSSLKAPFASENFETTPDLHNMT